MTSYIRSQILQLKKYQLSFYPETIKLNQNEIPEDLPKVLKEKILKKIEQIPWNRYPHPQPFALKEKLASLSGWPAEGILVTNGSNVLIQALLMATAVNGRALTLNPTFSLYEMEGKILGNAIDSIPLGEGFSLPESKILQAFQESPPQIVFLANPNAPTANLFEREALLRVIRAAPCLVVVDEAYFHFADYNLLSELSRHKNLVLLRTFSKACGLGGVRLGYLLAHPEIAEQVSKVLLPYCVSDLLAVIAETVLEESELVEERVALVCQEREKLYQSLTQIRQIRVYPSQTNFLIFQVEDAEKTFEKLLEEKILVRNVSVPLLPNTLRVTVGTPLENQKFLDGIRKIFPL